jgi:large subunit ribosomal protein L29
MKANEIRELTDSEIEARIKEDTEMLQRMYFNHAISEVESPAKIRMIKKDIARMHTILSQRKLQKQ